MLGEEGHILASNGGGRTCIFVLGMHRSGTSALARLLNLVGAALPKNLLGAGLGNEAGHWEPAQLVALNDSLLVEAGSRWDDWRALDLSVLEPERRAVYTSEACRLIEEEYGQAPLFVLKDPRICRMVPFYADTMKQLGIAPRFILALRNPLSVTASLVARDGTTEAFANLLWLRHVLDAERATRGASRTIVSYETLMDDWQQPLAKITEVFKQEWPKSPVDAAPEIAAFLNEELRHHKASPQDLSARTDMPAWITDTYEAMLALESDPQNTAALASLDKILTSFEPAAHVFGDATFGELAAREQRYAAARQVHTGATEALRNAMATRDEHIAALRAQGVARDQQLGALEARATQQTTDIGRLTSELGDRNAHVELLEGNLVASASDLRSIKGALEEHQTVIKQLEANLLASTSDVHRLEGARAEDRAAIKQLEADLLASASDVRRLEGARAEDHAAIQRLETNLLASTSDVGRLEGSLDERKSEISELEARLHSEQEAVHSLRAHIGQVEQEAAGSAHRAGALQNEVDILLKSRSWRITAPLRAVNKSLAGKLPQRNGLIARRRTAPADGIQAAVVQPQQAARPKFMGRDLASRLHALSNRILSKSPHRPHEIQLRPTHQLEARDLSGNVREWTMTGSDPRFEIVLPQASALPAGHYRLIIEFPDGWEALSRPSLYVDSGRGYSESECLELHFAPLKTQCAVATFSLMQGARSLRFDPGTRPGSIAIGRVLLRQVRRAEHYSRLFANIARAQVRRPQDLPQFTRKVLGHLTTGGPRGLLAALRSHRPVLDEVNSYQRWISLYDTISAKDAAAMRKQAQQFATKPLISVVMPVYNTPEKLLRSAIDSVRAQIYENWELCIADDHSPDPRVRNVLKEYEADPRIKVVYRSENGHISRASNSALEIATGEWIALLDHDDELAPHALYCVADAINTKPHAKLIYSDEDKIDELGRRYGPHFKCDFAPEMLRSMNYLNHLTVHRADLIRAVGGWRPGFEGSQDYDINLRVVEILDSSEIVHIPMILYHWRALKGSTALATSEKGYSFKAGFRALEEHLVRTDQNARVAEIPGLPFYRIRHDVSDPPLVSLIIPTKDRIDLLKVAVESIREKTKYPRFEILVIDNNSELPETQAYFDKISRLEGVRVIPYPYEFNYSAINNYAVGLASGDMIGLINNDIEVIEPDWLTEMVSWAQQDRIGCVGAKLYYPNGLVQHAGVITGVGGVAGHAHKGFGTPNHGYFARLSIVQDFSAVTAACMVMRKSVFNEVGGLNEKQLKVAFNDVDFCLRVREAGYVNVWTPFATLYHHESPSRGSENTPEKQSRFASEVRFMIDRWGNQLEADPYYSPNLTLDREDFSLAFPPRVVKPWRRPMDAAQ